MNPPPFWRSGCRLDEGLPPRLPRSGDPASAEARIVPRVSAYWWERTGRPYVGELEAVIVSLDRALTAGDCAVVRNLVWDLHCAGIRVAAVTSLRGAAVQRSVRDLLGDGAVELLLTGDDVENLRPGGARNPGGRRSGSGGFGRGVRRRGGCGPGGGDHGRAGVGPELPAGPRALGREPFALQPCANPALTLLAAGLHH